MTDEEKTPFVYGVRPTSALNAPVRRSLDPKARLDRTATRPGASPRNQLCTLPSGFDVELAEQANGSRICDGFQQT